MALKKPGDIFKHPQSKPVFTNISNIEEQLSKAEVLLPKEKVEELKQQLESVTNSIDTSLSEVSDGNVDYSVVRKELDRFNTKITHIEEDLNEKVDDLRRRHTDIKTGIQIVQTRQNNIHPEKLKEEVIHRVKNILIGNIGENIRELEERVDVIKGSYKQTLNEGLLNEPPTVNNSDPLTPLNKKFVTLDEFQSHYKLFINRIQTQLATLGGGGAVNIRELDDVDISSARVNGKYLKYNSTTDKWEGADASGGGGGNTLTIQDEGVTLTTDATALNFVGSGVVATGAGSTTKTIQISSGAGTSITVQDEGSSLSNAGTTLNFVGAGVSASGTGEIKTITISGGGNLNNIVEDTTPQLGGNLDVNGNDIVSVSNGDIELDPNGSGQVIFKGNATKGSGQFKLNCENNSHGITIKGPPHSAAASYTLTLPNNDGGSGEFLKTDGSGVLSWSSAGGLATRTTTTATTGSIAQAASTNITIPTAGKSFSLLKLTINAPAWVVLYIDSASRTSDASRTEGTDPAPGSGVLTEVSTTTSGASTFNMTPAVLGWNNDGTPAAQVYAKVTNKRATSGSNTITVTLTNLALEA